MNRAKTAKLERAGWTLGAAKESWVSLRKRRL